MNENELAKLHQKSLQTGSSIKIQNDEEGLKKYQTLAFVTILTLFAIIPLVVILSSVIYFVLQKRKLINYCRKITEKEGL